MKIEILEEKENPLLERKEVTFKLIPEGGGEPYEKVRERIAAMMDIDENTFVIQSMKSRFGKNEYRGFLKVYKNEEKMRHVEENHVLKRNGLIGEKK